MNEKKLGKDVNKILYVTNLPSKIQSDDLYELFGRYGPLTEVRIGNTPSTKGQAFIVFDDIWDAKTAKEALSSYSVAGRYIHVHYFSKEKADKKYELQQKAKELEKLKAYIAHRQQLDAKDTS
mmetsp:Transcript_9192/g.13606  ORF Transcript_9192/g.13606 Transcript_9192/m.13606 type:complete len:123 (-) Transcript_9192:9-377(-)